MLPTTNPTCTTMTSHAVPAEVSPHCRCSAGTTAVALNQDALASTAASETSQSARPALIWKM